MKILNLILFVCIGNIALAKIKSPILNPKTEVITQFSDAKKYLSRHMDLFDDKTIYCACKVVGKTIDLKSCNYKIQKNAKRASRLEWEHNVAAEAFGQSFSEWRVGGSKCQGKKGRKCAETNAEFAKMEADVYNLYPEIGELNGLRSNFSMAQLTSSRYDFGGCRAKILDKKFEPMDFAKGVTARNHLNMEARYPGRGIVSDKNKKLFEAWDKLYPVTQLECKRWKILSPVTGYRHLFANRCNL